MTPAEESGGGKLLLFVAMHGKAAHALSSAPAGINALDALVLGYQGAQVYKGLSRRDERLTSCDAGTTRLQPE